MNQVPVAGVDVSKEFSDMCILAPDNTVFAQVKIYHDLANIERSLTFLRNAEHQFGEQPILIMEATGHYHRLQWQFMLRNGYEVIGLVLSHAMYANVAFEYCHMLWGIEYAGYSAPADVAFLLAIPYLVDIIITNEVVEINVAFPK